MKTEQVTKVWEFYRDTTDNYKEPMRKQLRKLDSYVDHLESLADDGEKAAEENERLRLEVKQLEEERDEHFRRYDELEAENAKLRDESSKYHDLYINAIADAEVWHLQWSAEHQENAKLRELADAVKEFVEDTHCEDCPCRRDCDDNNRIFCADDFSYHAFAAMRELSMEVD